MHRRSEYLCLGVLALLFARPSFADSFDVVLSGGIQSRLPWPMACPGTQAVSRAQRSARSRGLRPQ